MWLVNRRDDATTRPSVAAVGLAADAATDSTSRAEVDPMGELRPQFLDGTAAAARPEPVAAVVGTGAGATIATATAIFRRSVTDRRTCAFSGVPSGTYISVVNVANDRSVECWTMLRPVDAPQGELVMSAAAFGEIADPTTAPIHVEIREP